jgi:hypothetical protein
MSELAVIKYILNPFVITILFIVAAAVIAAFIQGRRKDKCLKDFADCMITLHQNDNKTVWGKMRVENTGIELLYKEKHLDKQKHVESSYILYKYEFAVILALLRFHDQLTDKNKKKRQRQMQKTYHPGTMRRFKRKVRNTFNTVRDSVMDVANLMLTQAKKVSPAGAVLTGQDKYVSKMQQEIIGSTATAYEPLLERYIGHLVVLELLKNDKVIEYPGVLKEYTADFIELMDVNYQISEDQPPRKADIIVPRKLALVRHLGE